jgi:hypothetical protein
LRCCWQSKADHKWVYKQKQLFAAKNAKDAKKAQIKSIDFYTVPRHFVAIVLQLLDYVNANPIYKNMLFFAIFSRSSRLKKLLNFLILRKDLITACQLEMLHLMRSVTKIS